MIERRAGRIGVRSPTRRGVLVAALTIAAGGLVGGVSSSAQAAGVDRPAAGAYPKVSLCTPVAVRTTHGTRMEAYCRLAHIDHGTVSCVEVATAKAATCAFLPNSGRWLESTSGDLFAMAGQAISRDGMPGGRYVVASRLSRHGYPPCVKPSRRPTAVAADSVGVVGTVDMGGACTIEVNNSAHNTNARYGIRMDNYATREVCTSSFPHPDGAELVRKPREGVFCYKGRGAALNDRHGRERGPNGWYLPGPERCHVAWTAPPESGGREFYAAKRPNTMPYPVPGRVVETSPILWRPVSNVTVAN